MGNFGWPLYLPKGTEKLPSEPEPESQPPKSDECELERQIDKDMDDLFDFGDD